MRCLLLVLLAGCRHEYGLDAHSPIVGGQPPLSQPHQVDHFRYVEPPDVSVLFVVDHSCSMRDNQVRLIDNMSRFLTALPGDWRIGVLSAGDDAPSDEGLQVEPSGYLGGIVRPGEDAYADFVDATFSLMDQEGERGIEAVREFLRLRNEPGNRGLVDVGRPLHVVTVSDEEEQSEWGPEDLAAALEAYERTYAAPATYSAIVTTHEDLEQARCESDGASVGYRYLDAVELVGGQAHSICDLDWTPAIDALAEYVSMPIQDLHLSRLPEVSTIRVWTEHSEVAAWEYVPVPNAVRVSWDVPWDIWVSYAERL